MPLATQGVAVARFGFPSFACPTWLLVVLAVLVLLLIVGRRRG